MLYSIQVRYRLAKELSYKDYIKLELKKYKTKFKLYN